MLKLHYSEEHNHWWFTMVANNGRVLMTSETYPTKRIAERGMAAVQRVARSIAQ